MYQVITSAVCIIQKKNTDTKDILRKNIFCIFLNDLVHYLFSAMDILSFTIEVTERHAILTIKEADKFDDGPYRLNLENSLGSDSAVFKVQINGVFEIVGIE